MFQSLNLFKSLNCPFYSPSTNTLTCDRPYCQFKHPNLNSQSSSSTLTAQASTTFKQDAPNQTISTNESIKKPENKKTGISDLNQLPSMLENISNALQTVQQIISASSLNADSIAKLSSNSSNNQTASQLSVTLANLNNVLQTVSTTKTNPEANEKIILEKSHSNTSSPCKKSSSSKSLKRQQSAPDYNPTPIEELKKRAEIETSHTTSNGDDQTEETNSTSDTDECLKRRKCTDSESSSSNDSLPETKKSTKIEEKNVKKLKVEETTTTTTISSQANGLTAKCDLVSFSKLSLSQQVLKRYEMMNKPAPTAVSIIEAKLKKHQAAHGGGGVNGAAAKSDAQNQNVPHLIMDTNTSTSNKIPLVMRQRYLKAIFENGRSSFSTIQKACEKAAEQEKSIYDRAKNKTIYTNLAANLIRSLRTQQQSSNSSSSSSATTSVQSTTKLSNVKNAQFTNNINKIQVKATIIQEPSMSYSHETMLSGPKATKVSYSINRIKQLEFKDLSMSQLYKIFCSYVLTEKQLEENSFPIWTDSTSKKFAYIPNLKKTLVDTNNKKKTDTNNDTNQQQQQAKQSDLIIQTCKRCNRTFSLRSKDMFYLSSNSECVFHWGKLRNVRIDKVIEQKYSCCSGGINSDGCEVGKHVYDGDYNGNGNGSNLAGYIQVDDDKITTSDTKTCMNVYALDCEMCYTTKGLELTRISIVDINSKEVYESLVKPDTQILDYNTRWSGLTEDSLRNCSKKLKHVQADLMKIFNRDTILIGHSLESDFKALKLIHTNVIDTSVVFPHKMGPPYKRALRNLMSEHLQKIIQEDVEGHDSKEDAASCISLMIWKINEDLRTKKFNSILNVNSNSGNNLAKLDNRPMTTNSMVTTNNKMNTNNNQRNNLSTSKLNNTPKIASK